MSDTARPAETVSESVPARHETPDVAELRRLYSEWQETVNPYGFRLMPSGEYYALAAAAVNALPALLDDADALLDEADRLAHMTEARNNARAEVKRLTAIVEAVRALHQPKHYADADMRAIAPSLPAEVCGDCWGRGDSAVPWPCPTARILDGDPQQ